ncbi:MAG: hypothetical protein JRI72_01615 [Deltaproteobacteria bacterium]|nr:hypothetical protein [Deltaproteobacteria bacterium]
MPDLHKVLEFIWEKGWVAALVVILILIIHKPDRAEELKEIIFRPLFRFFRLSSRQYLAAKVNYTSTEFLRKEIWEALPSSPHVKIRVKWVRSSSDPVLMEDGTLVLRLRETKDQTLNVLSATGVVIPQVICPTLRSNLGACPRIALFA